MLPVKHSRHNGRGRNRTFALLLALGVPGTEFKPVDVRFWENNSMTLEYIGQLARKKYLASARRLHPDRNGDSRRMTELNTLWGTLRKRFAKNGIKL